MKKAVLILNLGTPAACNARAIKHYLAEFLLDKRVIDLPWFVRWPLVKLIIIPARYRKTLAAYQKIWQADGSPLFTISRKIQLKLADKLGADYQIELAMRYGQPSIESELAKFKPNTELIILPLFPQYSSAVSGSILSQIYRYFIGWKNLPKLKVVNEFYCHPAYIASCAAQINSVLATQPIDRLVFSYHGLPSHHLRYSCHQTQCASGNVACSSLQESNVAYYCYRAQCYETARLIVAQLGLRDTDYIVAFQSRLGATPWIKPYTDVMLPDLYADGVRKLAIFSPSFIADCLETLEELNLRARQQWVQLGGEQFHYIPCVNDNELLITALAELVQKS